MSAGRYVLRSLGCARDDKWGRRVGCGVVGVEVPRLRFASLGMTGWGGMTDRGLGAGRWVLRSLHFGRDDKRGRRVGCVAIRVEVPPLRSG